MLQFIVNWLAGTPSFAAPYALAALGLIISERAGVLSLGAEGFMLVGALAGVASRSRAWRLSGDLACGRHARRRGGRRCCLRFSSWSCGSIRSSPDLAIVFFCQGLTSLVGTLGGLDQSRHRRTACRWRSGHCRTFPIVGRILFTPGSRGLSHHPDLLCCQLLPVALDARPAAALGRGDPEAADAAGRERSGLPVRRGGRRVGADRACRRLSLRRRRQDLGSRT